MAIETFLETQRIKNSTIVAFALPIYLEVSAA
jgi:hypothetical protein